MKALWASRSCGCVKANLRTSGRVMIRCERHRGKPAKKGRLLAHFGEATIITRTEA